jgi:hypothetical protein
VFGLAFLPLGGLFWGVFAYQRWLRNGVQPRTVRSALDADSIRDIFLATVCTSGWHIVDDGNPLVAQSSLATGTRQQLAMKVTVADDGRLDARIWPARLMVKSLSRVPTKGHTLRMRMNRFVNALEAADPGAQRPVAEAAVEDPTRFAAERDPYADPYADAYLAPAAVPVPDVLPSAWEAPRPVDLVALEAGWYPDPLAADRLRWWDGSTWTTHSQPADDVPHHAYRYR